MKNIIITALIALAASISILNTNFVYASDARARSTTSEAAPSVEPEEKTEWISGGGEKIKQREERSDFLFFAMVASIVLTSVGVSIYQAKKKS